MNNSQKQDEWMLRYKDREEANYEEYIQIIHSNNELLKYINIGISHVTAYAYDEAVRVLGLGIDIGEQLLYNDDLIDENELAKIYMNRGIAYEYMKNHEKALIDKSKSICILEQINLDDSIDKNLLATSYMNRGQTYISMDKYDMASQDTEKSIMIWNQMKKEGRKIDENSLSLANANISIIRTKANSFTNKDEDELYFNMKNIDNSLKLQNISKDDKGKLAEMHTMRGLSYYHNNKMLEALSDLDESIKISEQICNSGKQIDINNYAMALAGRGIVYYQEGENDRAMSDLTKCIDIWERLLCEKKQINEELLYNAYLIRGSILNALVTQTDTAISDYIKSLEVAKRLSAAGAEFDVDGIILAYMGIGTSYEQQDNFAEANLHYDNCIEIMEEYLNSGKAIDENTLAIAYMNRGSNYYSFQEIDKAISDYSKCIFIRESLSQKGIHQNAFDLFMAYKNRSQAYEMDANPEKAISDLMIALRILKGEFQLSIQLQTQYYDVLDELIQLCIEGDDKQLLQKVLHEFLHSMRQVPKVQEAETKQNILLGRWAN